MENEVSLFGTLRYLSKPDKIVYNIYKGNKNTNLHFRVVLSDRHLGDLTEWCIEISDLDKYVKGDSKSFVFVREDD